MTSSPDNRVPAAGFDVMVIGAGPAGLAAAVAAARTGRAGGIRVALLDAGARPGGQYWRHREGHDGSGHHDWATFLELRAALDDPALAGSLAYLPDHPVWHLERSPDGFTAHVVRSAATVEVGARSVILATGAYDRQLPFPGWTLPGVLAAGGVQALLKGQGVVAGRRIVVAGTGPFLLPVAAGLAEAGADVAGVFEAGRPTAVLRHPVTAARNASKLREAAGYLATLARHRIPYRTGRTVVAAHGSGEVEAVTTAALDPDWRVVEGSQRRIECDTVAVGYGFTPQVELAGDLDCAMVVDADGSLVVEVDGAQRTSTPGAFAAGESCGVGGAALALVEGELAGLHASAAATGRRPDLGTQGALERRRAHLREFAGLLALAWPVRSGWRTWLTDDTLVCRCEEVPAAAIRGAVGDLGATDARGAKLFARSGMGLCQGRVCGYATSSLVAAALGREPGVDDLLAAARRPVAWPVTLGALAAPVATPAAGSGSDPAVPTRRRGSTGTGPTQEDPA